jgi:hypothetical protein
MPGFPVSKSAVTNFVHALIAVLGGNAAYLLLMPYLPPGARHVGPHIDLGLVVDFWFCLVVLGIVKTVAKKRGEAKLHRQ